LPGLTELASQPDCPRTAILQLAELEILAGATASARARLAVFDSNSDLESAFLFAQADLGDGRAAAALEQLRSIRAKVPHAPLPLLIVQIRALQALSRPLEAIAVLREALTLAPRQVDLHIKLVDMLFTLGDIPGTKLALASALRLNPNSSQLWHAHGALLFHEGDRHTAEQAFRRATELDPGNTEAQLALGRLLIGDARHSEAMAVLSQAAQATPGDPVVESLLGHAAQETGDVEQALMAYARARTRDSADLRIVMGEALLLPQIYRDGEDVVRWRERFSLGLAQLQAMAADHPLWTEQVLHLQRTNFLLAYQGQNDLELQRGYSQLLRSLMTAALPGLAKERPSTFLGQRRLRVGFASSHLCLSTAGLYFERWITDLDPAKFERWVFDLGSFPDAVNARIRSSVDHFFRLDVPTGQMARQIAEAELDVLVYPEVGMDCNIYLLATLRLAPVQCAGWGHPVTTGSSEIDYFLSCSEMEPPDSQDHYVERLVLLPGIGVDYLRPDSRLSAKRSDFGLPEDKNLYFCPQSLFKVHPEMDRLLAGLLAVDPNAVLVMFQSNAISITKAFARRLEATMAAHDVAPRNQLKFLPRMGAAEFRSALSLADVVLDTVHWSGGNTSLDAFAAGTPVVSLPGKYMRGRQTAGMLGLLDLSDLVAESEEHYVDLATRVAKDKAWRLDLVRRLLANRDNVFNRADATQAFGDALLRIAQKQ